MSYKKMAEIKSVILIAVSLMVIAVIFPIALALIGTADEYLVSNVSGTEVYLTDVIDPSILTLLTVLLPIIAIISIVMYFLPRTKKA